MDEDNWWLYLIGAIAAYMLIPWRVVFKWAAVAACVAMAFTLSTDAGQPPVYRLIGGLFFFVIAIVVARSEYREDESKPSLEREVKSIPEPRRPCFFCNDTGRVPCYCPTKREKRDIFGPACFECNDTKYKRCNMCKNNSWW